MVTEDRRGATLRYTSPPLPAAAASRSSEQASEVVYQTSLIGRSWQLKDCLSRVIDIQSIQLEELLAFTSRTKALLLKPTINYRGAKPATGLLRSGVQDVSGPLARRG